MTKRLHVKLLHRIERMLHSAARIAVGPRASVPRRRLQKRRNIVTYVLIVEDDPAVAAVLGDAFGAAGYRFFVLRKKASAGRFLHRLRPDLVIVDYGLIDGSGIEAAQMAAEAKVPVVVTSGHLGVREEVEALGFLFLQKPFRPSQVFNAIEHALGQLPPE